MQLYISPQPLSRSFILFNFQEHNEVSTIILNYSCSTRLLNLSRSCPSPIPPNSCTKPTPSAHTPTLSIPRVSHQSPRTPLPSAQLTISQIALRAPCILKLHLVPMVPPRFKLARRTRPLQPARTVVPLSLRKRRSLRLLVWQSSTVWYFRGTNNW